MSGMTFAYADPSDPQEAVKQFLQLCGESGNTCHSAVGTLEWMTEFAKGEHNHGEYRVSGDDSKWTVSFYEITTVPEGEKQIILKVEEAGCAIRVGSNPSEIVDRLVKAWTFLHSAIPQRTTTSVGEITADCGW